MLGFTPAFFYDSTVREIYDLMEASRKRKRNESKEALLMQDTLSTLVVDKIGSILDKNHKPTSVIEMFPDFFPEEKARKEAQLIKQQQELNKIQFLEFARRKLKKTGGESV